MKAGSRGLRTTSRPILPTSDMTECSICNKHHEGHGNNAILPGPTLRRCNVIVVIPKRINSMHASANARRLDDVRLDRDDFCMIISC